MQEIVKMKYFFESSSFVKTLIIIAKSKNINLSEDEEKVKINFKFIVKKLER